MQEFEKLGQFYLGRLFNLESKRPEQELLLYDSKDLTTHAVCVGMTGSGKTGLCLTLLEEAGIDGIPAIAIDPKGDLGNLLLTFPNLDGNDFLPWVDESAALRKGMTIQEYSADTAEQWRNGLAEWGQTSERISRLRSAVDMCIYTPGGTAGIPLSVLRSFQAPSVGLLADADALRSLILSTVSGLLALLGIDADPIRSREHILLSNLFDRAWREGRNLDMASLIQEIGAPPFDKIGVMDLETFFPANDRFGLSLQLNNLLASPAFATWMEGDSLDVGRLLYTAQGKPRLSIISIAHLGDTERMFFVTILLNEVLSWMRAQSGTSSLRAILYMDEVFGYFPPTANPPSKTPMLTLLKQARAYGLGVVLATQNPVDLDYKGLSNAGTWFLGRLQTERDKARVLEGLEGASATAGKAFNRSELEATLAGLSSRVFLMNNVHEDTHVVFQTRWSLSYLRGPLTRDQISFLMHDRKSTAPLVSAQTIPTKESATVSINAGGSRPILPPGIRDVFIIPKPAFQAATILYRPAILGKAKLHFMDAKSALDRWEDAVLLAVLDETLSNEIWDRAESFEPDHLACNSDPSSMATYGSLPTEANRPQSYKIWQTALKNFVHQYRTSNLFHCSQLKQKSRSDESESDFRARMKQMQVEQRDLEVEKLRKKYAPKLATLQESIRKAEQQVEKQKSDVGQQTLQTALSFGATVLGAMFGRKIHSATNVNKAATSIRAASRIVKEKGDVTQAQETAETRQQNLADLEQEFQEESERIVSSYGDGNPEIVVVPIRARKSEIQIQSVELAWTPWVVDASGRVTRAF